MKLKPVVTEKAVMRLEGENMVIFEMELGLKKEQIKAEVEKIFDVKVASVRTQIRSNKKYAYIKLKKEFSAMDLATKLGMI